MVWNAAEGTVSSANRGRGLLAAISSAVFAHMKPRLVVKMADRHADLIARTVLEKGGVPENSDRGVVEVELRGKEDVRCYYARYANPAAALGGLIAGALGAIFIARAGDGPRGTVRDRTVLSLGQYFAAGLVPAVLQVLACAGDVPLAEALRAGTEQVVEAFAEAARAAFAGPALPLTAGLVGGANSVLLIVWDYGRRIVSAERYEPAGAMG